MEHFRPYIESIGAGIEAVGVLVVVIGAVIATAVFLRSWVREGALAAYTAFRSNLARSVLLGLEFLVAGDIIRTVVVHPSIANVGSLAVIVLVRTFLSLTLEMEISGRWPWQRHEHGGERQA